MQQSARKKPITLDPFHEFILDCLDKNEDGDARLYSHLHRERFCYDHTEGRWYIWNGHSWTKDRTDKHFAAINDVIRQYEDEGLRQAEHEIAASSAGDDEARKNASENYSKLIKRIQKLRAINRKKHIIELSTWGDGGLGITGDEWDREPYLLTCQNGVVNLRTGELSTGNQKQHLRTPCPINYDPNADAPELFIKFLNEVFSDNWELVKYVKRLIGYSLIGGVIEHILPIFWGSGRNGKDTLIQAVLCGENGFHALNQKNFGIEIKSRFDSYKPKAVYYIGIKLSDSSDSSDNF